jgi:hypothetical protein
VSDLITTTMSGDGTLLRILVCHTCKAMVPIPDVPGGRGDDEMLMARVMEHQFPPVHHGNEVQSRPHEMILCRLPEALWNNASLRANVVKEIQAHVGGAGDGEGLGELYDVRNNFMEDAMACWRFEHGRTTNCGDYMSDKKKILSDSAADRRELGLNPKTRASVKLCQFCPYHSVVVQRARKAKGAYN